tara:strand:- start:317 stop:1144 length:828 start_codon:yes stop_codon:yes gene_type:complete
MYVLSRFKKGPGMQSNLYTKGGEFSDPKKLNANSYRGPYHLVHGRAYKGAEATKFSWQYPLIPISRVNQNFQYNQLKREDYAKEFKGVISGQTMISDKDEDRGWMYRFIAQYLPSGEVFEVDEEQHDMILAKKTPHHDLYATAKMKWKIAGPIFDRYKKAAIDEYGIIDTNRRSIEILEDTIPGLSGFLLDLMQFSKPFEEEDKYTDGLEFEDEDGVPYKGPYHVHEVQGIMKGAYHTDKPHGRLRPIPYQNPPRIDEQRMRQTPQNIYNAIKGK